MTATGQQTRQEAYSAEVLLGSDAAGRRLRVQVGRIAPHFRSALLVGEAGTGKRTIAEELHRLSPAGTGPFVAMDLAEALGGDGVVEVHGTLYLHGLERLDAGPQAVLAREFKGWERRQRLVLASECELRGLLAAGRMSAEVCAVLEMPVIRVSPLRERLGAVEEVAAAMLRRMGAGASFSPGALLVLRRHLWPGNMDELAAVCLQVARPGAVIEAEELPPLGEPTQQMLRLEDVVARHVRDVLQRCAGNKLKAAELLGISRSTLYRMLEA